MYKFLFCSLFVTNALGFIGDFYRSSETKTSNSSLRPLLLSNYIRRGDITRARNLSLVRNLTPYNVTSYSGFITINKTCGDNLFFWFFPSQNDWLNDPVVAWLNGGPGASSLIGCLEENSPYRLTLNYTLTLNEYAWNRNSSVIYIDNPVGAGFSFTTRGCYIKNQHEVGRGLIKMLQQFFQLFPEIKKNPFFVFGQSYGGKHVPTLAYYIHNSPFGREINLRGFAVGNGLTDPINQVNYSDYLYQLGLIDSKSRKMLSLYEQFIVKSIQEGEYKLALTLYRELFDKFKEVFGYYSLYHYLYNEAPPIALIEDFVTREEVRKAIHVGNANYSLINMDVYGFFADDIMRSIRPWVEELLNHDYRVVFYAGQLDIICAYPLVVNFIQNLNWTGTKDYQKAERDMWFVGNELAGYAKTAGKFTEILVRNSGHMVPRDQPKWALDLYHRIIFNKPFGVNISDVAKNSN